MKLPKWLDDAFAQSFCISEKCERKLHRKGVIGVGIREEAQAGSDETILSFCYEYRCPYCGNRSVFSGFPTTIEDFVADMMEIGGFPIDEVDEPPKKSKISNSEVSEAKRIINNSKNFEELMEKMGINREYIEWFRHKPGNDEDKQDK